MEEEKKTVRAVERALDVLLCFASGHEWGLTEIAGKVGLHKSTIHRLLATLEDRGFVTRDPSTEKYRLGLSILELSAHLSRSDDPSVMLLPEMERLRDQLNETISLYVRDRTERVRIQAVQSMQAIRRVATVGARLPLSVGASSKVLLAFADPGVRSAVLTDPAWPAQLERETFAKQLDDILAAGYATSFEEREPGAAAVAAPIFNRSGKLVAALSVSGPSNRLTPDRMHEFAPAIVESAHRMGTMLG
ncbi:IclR family transcriptional regulator [Cohnella sp. CIP 111063]|jgi:IclR family KDG regulon transcriptional repressor|uniref:IclR family transcriptional regulator n=1 Tax=unclassified Cohnella TaxID=2636738 RepID=UPI000B8BB4D7|nr:MULTISPECIES: IclR family transcriptional regulator [unclassified Cohnella]OXS56845.1 IclR family transcriptional regulator [Cohnella sp. CIP 111063]PRX69680.1 IclR family transcriptional regulator [Cohnella sp. SGD-V74]